MALSADRSTPRRDDEFYSYPCAAAKQFYRGQIVALDASGNAQPMAAAASQICVGISQQQFLSTSAAAENLEVRTGCFKLKNSATDAITKTEVGKVCYAEDDETVCKTSTTKSPVGYVVALDTDGVWVRIHAPANANPSLALLVANDLSDVHSAATARANIAANKVALTARVANLVGGDAKVYRVVSPVAGDIAKIYSILEGHALATGNATITASINGTPVTTGAITITQAGSAEGDIDNVTPSAAKTVAAGDAIELTVGGTNDNTAAFADVTIYIET
jgi:hypothetical protein